MAKYRCPLCGYIYDEAVEGPFPDDFRCPMCGCAGENFELLEEDAAEAPDAAVSSDDGSETAEAAPAVEPEAVAADAPRKFAKYQCPLCGYIYDEAVEGPFPDDFRCPMCGCSGKDFIRIDDGAEARADDAAAEEPAVASDATSGEQAGTASSIAYPRETARTDPSIRHMETVHKLALSGEPIHAAMATTLPLPSWDSILVLGNQLAQLPLAADADVSLQTTIGPRADKPFVMDRPVYVSHMSFGALSKEAKVALATGAAMAKTAMCSGEGGVLEDEFAASHGYIFEFVPNRYSDTDENLQRASAIEIKVGQGTKPGMGGHLPGDKVTPAIAEVRGRPAGHEIVSPSTFPGIRTVDDMKELVDSLRERSLGRPVGIKVAAGHIEADLEFAVAAGADFVTIDGRGGATGSSPSSIRDATSVPTIYALSRARRYLDANAPDVSLVITGGLRVAEDFAKAIAMGADAVAIATSALMAIGCQQYRICGSNMCPVGIATQDPALRARFDGDAGAQRLANFLEATYESLRTFGRITGNVDIHGLSLANLVTTDRDIAERCGIERA